MHPRQHHRQRRIPARAGTQVSTHPPPASRSSPTAGKRRSLRLAEEARDPSARWLVEWTTRSNDSPSGGRHGLHRIDRSAPVGNREADDPGLRNRVEARAEPRPAGTEVAATGRTIARARALRRKRASGSRPCPVVRRSCLRPEAATSRRLVDAAALLGIASARLAGVRVVALDDEEQPRNSPTGPPTAAGWRRQSSRPDRAEYLLRSGTPGATPTRTATAARPPRRCSTPAAPT